MKNFIREKAMDSNKITREYFDEILIEMRHIDGVKPDTSMTLYEKVFSTPIMMAALSHLKGKDGKDLDHSFDSRGCYDKVLGFPMSPRSLKDIEGYCKKTKLPFILKGVLSATDAKKCLMAGVGGIVVSHHHGIVPTLVPPLMVLPEIVEVIKGRIPIFVDCGIMNGADAFKALALGATAVSVGRPVMHAIAKDGAQGAADTINGITAELAGVMARTASGNIKDINPTLLWRRDGGRI